MSAENIDVVCIAAADVMKDVVNWQVTCTATYTQKMESDMTETENREVLEQKMAKAIEKAAKDIVSPPRSCPHCAAIGTSSRFGTDSPRREALVVEIDRDSGKANFRTYRNGDPHISGPDGTIDQVAVIALAFLLDLECRSIPIPAE